jgi:putative glutamine amidotransferase
MNFKKTLVFYLLVAFCLTLSFGAVAQTGSNEAQGKADEVRIGVIYSTSQAETFKAGRGDQVKACREAIEVNGGVVVELNQNDSIDDLLDKLATLHGVLVPGGIDVDPRFYRERNSPKLEKFDTEFDQMEFNVLDYARMHQLAVLGICRGHQALNVYYGGSLIQDIPTEYQTDDPETHRKPRGAMHPIKIDEGSLMHKLTGETEMVVNTSHHQSVKKLAPGFTVTARAKDNTVEAMEYDSKDHFVLGVQFHPEAMRAQDERCNRIFVRLIEEAKKVKERLKQPVAELIER